MKLLSILRASAACLSFAIAPMHQARAVRLKTAFGNC